jgi:hypothetical protein
MTMMRLFVLSLLSISLAVQMTPAGSAIAQDAVPAVPTTEESSTPRLAWFYKPPQNGNLAPLVENFSTFILTVNDEIVRDTLKTEGISGPFLQYLRFDAIQNPGSCLAQPFQNQVAYEIGDFCRISRNHPGWFLLDSSGSRIMHDGYYRMDPGNLEWRAYWLARARRMQETFGWDGVFLDNVQASWVVRGSSSTRPARYRTSAEYEAAVEGFIAFLYDSYFEPNGRPLYANISDIADEAVWLQYLEHLDGLMDEAWAVNWDNGYRAVDDWLTQLNRMEQAEAIGKQIILVSQGSRTDYERQEFAYASYLLVTNGLASFRYANYDNYDQVWLYDNYRFDLGAPLGERYLYGALYRRDFERGFVTVDPVYHTASIDLTEAAHESSHAVPRRNVMTTPSPLLTWNEITWATRYAIQVDTDPAFTGSQVVDTVVGASAGQLSLGALANGEYFWRVRAKRPDGTWSLWSRVDTFTISAP